MTKTSPAAMKAQVQMFNLLSQHFDGEKGAYSAPWTDEKVAKEVGLSVETVADYRRAGFGELREPAELRTYREDLKALDNLCKETFAGFQQEVASLRSRLADLSRRYAL